MAKSFILFTLICLHTLLYSTDTHGEVLFAVGEYPPYISQHMEGLGIVTKIVTEACKRADIRPRYTFYPWSRAFKITERGQADASFLWVYNDERSHLVDYSRVHISEGITAIFYKKKNFPRGIEFPDYMAIKEYNIVGVRDYWYRNQFDSIGKTDVYYVSTEDSALRILINDRADIYISDLLTGMYLSRKVIPDQYKTLTISKIQQNPDKHFIIYPKNGSRELKTKLDKALQTMHDDGTYERMLLTLEDQFNKIP